MLCYNVFYYSQCFRTMVHIHLLITNERRGTRVMVDLLYWGRMTKVYYITTIVGSVLVIAVNQWLINKCICSVKAYKWIEPH